MGKSFDYMTNAPKNAAINVLKSIDAMIEMIIEHNVIKDMFDDDETCHMPLTYDQSGATSMLSGVPNNIYS